MDTKEKGWDNEDWKTLGKWWALLNVIINL
jgi:hypothetical protein